MCQDRVDLRGSGLHQLVGGQADRAASVGHVVDLHNTNIKMSNVIKIRMPEPYNPCVRVRVHTDQRHVLACITDPNVDSTCLRTVQA